MYAKLQPFQYHQVGQRQYQSFDPQSLTFSLYPIIHQATASLAQGNKTDCADAESKKEGDSDSPATVDVGSEQKSPVSTDDPPPTDSGGKCRNSILLTRIPFPHALAEY